MKTYNNYNSDFSTLTAFKCNYLENINCAEHVNIEIELVVVFEGSLTMNINGRKYNINSGEGLFVMPFEPHDFVTKNHSKGIIALLAGKHADDFFTNVSNKEPLKRTFSLSSNLVSYMENCIVSDNSQSENFKNMLLSVIFYEISVQCEFSDNKYYDDVFLHAMSYINKNYTSRITLKNIAANIGVHPVYLSRLFSKNTKMNIKQYINNLRIMKAVSIMQNGTNKTITDIAFECGFESVRNFNRVFLSINHCTPTEFKIRK